jgi:hypothetical protein
VVNGVWALAWAQKKSEVKAAKAAKQQPTTTNIGSSRGAEVKRTVHSKLRIVSGRVRAPAHLRAPSLPSAPRRCRCRGWPRWGSTQKVGCGGAFHRNHVALTPENGRGGCPDTPVAAAALFSLRRCNGNANAHGCCGHQPQRNEGGRRGCHREDATLTICSQTNSSGT